MFKPLALAAALLAGPALAQTDLTDMSAAERDAFGTAVREYLLENPQVLMEAIAVLENQEAAAQAQDDAGLIAQNAAALFEDGRSWVGGNPDGDVTVVEFLDYRCGYCRRAFPEVQELVESDGNIRLIVKEFPILGEQSTLSSRFAIAVQRLGGDAAYETVHDALMTLRGDVTPEALADLAEEVDLDIEAVTEEMQSDEVTARIADIHALGRDLQINGTPSFVFGDQMVRGYVPLEAMRDIVASLRE